MPAPDSKAHLAVIPARGGSRGIPRKNLEVVGGLPLVVRTVRTALASGVFAAVVVSTDDAEIATAVAAHGAEVVKRPAELAQDASPTEPVMEHALIEVERRNGARFDAIWLLQPTSPFLEPDDIRRARNLMEEGGCDSVVGVHEGHDFMWTEKATEGLVEPNYELAARPRRQDMPATYHENGALYAVVRDLWDKHRVRAAGRVAPLVLPWWRSADIDEREDLRAARALAAGMTSGAALSGFDLSAIRAVALDFDGVMTDDGVLVDQNGKEAVVCSRRDGMGISRLREAGIEVAVFSTETNPVVARRCQKLGIECQQGLPDKQTAVIDWLEAKGLSANQLAFVGNDVNDLACLDLAALSVVPADAHPDVKWVANLVLTSGGGKGAVRELADLLLA